MSGPRSIKRARSGSNQTLIRTAPIRIFGALDEDGGRVNEKILVARAEHLLDLVAEMAKVALAEHWNATDAQTFSDPTLPAFAYKAWAKVFGWQPTPSGLHAPSRVVWLALEVAGRTLRSAAHRRQIVNALITAEAATDEPTKAAILAQRLPHNADAVSIRNLDRRLTRFVREQGHRATSFFELEPTPPAVARQALLAATDRQFCQLERDLKAADETVNLRLLLPLRARPRSRADWAWHQLSLRRPEHLTGTPCRPTLRISRGRLLADLPLEREVPAVMSMRPQQPLERVLGLDWGVNSPLVGAIVSVADDRSQPGSDGRPFHFHAAGLLVKIARLGREIDILNAKLAHYARLIPVPGSALAIKAALLTQERDRVATRLRHLNQALGHVASRWAIEQGRAHEADAIVLEELSTLEAGGLGRATNRRVSGAVRGLIAKGIIEKAQLAGIRVIAVNARGTSSRCPGCGGPAHHTAAPDRTSFGYRWLRCQSCDTSLDRDHASAIVIGGRGLAPGAKSVARVASPPSPRPAHGTLPARGPRARIRRQQLARPGAGSPATPHRRLAGYRSAGAGTRIVQGTIQSRTTLPVRVELPLRRLDGLRSAYLGMLRMTPILGVSTAFPDHRAQVSAG
jgi:IS605 OrfB family transposase